MFKLISKFFQPTLKDILSDFSIDVWDKLGKTKKGLFPFYNFREDAFTSNLLAILADYMAKTPCNLRLFHAANEKVNGNDIEILLEVEKSKFLLLPCQAKNYIQTRNIQRLNTLMQVIKNKL